MEMFWLFVIGAVVGSGFTLLGIFMNYKVKDREWWEEYERETEAARSGLKKAVAENAQLRVALAAGEMTEDAKKVATMILASFDAAIAGTENAA
jgi:hypothetical protein